MLLEDAKIERAIEQYIGRTNYFVEYLHWDNRGVLDGFLDHKNNMYVLNNEYNIRKSICDTLYEKYKTHEFSWSNQSYTALASPLFKHMRGWLPESQYNTQTRQMLDDFYPRVLQRCSTQKQPEGLVNIDISKCYPSKLIIINNVRPIPVYTIHDTVDLVPCYNDLHMPTSNMKYKITIKKSLKPDTFRAFLTYIFKIFPESQAKMLANSFIGELGRKYSRNDHGFTSRDMDTAQCIWTSTLAEGKNITIDNCDPPRDFNAKGESTRTTRFHFKTKEFILTRFSTLAILPH